MIRLDPANSRYEPQRYDEDRVRIQGRLAGPDPALLRWPMPASIMSSCRARPRMS